MHPHRLARAAVLALGAASLFAACASSGDSAATTSLVTTTSTSSTTAPLAAPAKVELRPVVSSGRCDRPPPTPPPASQPVFAVGATSRDGVTCYLVGDPAIDAVAAVDTARAVPERGADTWQVEVTFAADQQGEVGALYNRCHSTADSCPSQSGGPGAVATLVDGAVVAVLPVADTDEAAGTVVVADGLTRADARTLAGALDG